MKTKAIGNLAAVSLSILACGALLSVAPARACTVFCDSQGDTVLAGRSFDIPDNPNLGMLLVPATGRTHGWFCCGRFACPWADGMNDQGLFVAVASVPTPAAHTTTSSRQPADLQTFISRLLANCASVVETVEWCKRQPAPRLDGWANQNFLGYYTFSTPEHILVADRSGDSVVLEWYHGKLKMTRKQGRYQLMTNFLLTDPKAGWYPCPRYIADSRILDKAATPALETCRQVLETTAAGSTRYSLVCDLTHGDVYVYLRQRFERPKTLHLADELRKGRHELDLDQWFGRPKPDLLSPPPVIARSTLSAAEILQRALAARGGGIAAAKIRSLHGKGTVNLVGMPSLAPLPTELFWMRPNHIRQVTDFVVSAGPNLGRYVAEFDGLNGWDAYLDDPPHFHRGEDYDLQKDGAALFGWYDEPGNYETVECLGEAQFDGKLCYDLKLVTQTHHEEFHYYDATNFLLAGTFTLVAPQYGSGWDKTAYSDYRAFDGFLMPMRIADQNDAGSYPLQFSSLEINTVTNIPSAPLPAPVLVHLDSRTYDEYVGQYRKPLLFGLLHLGPTLSISHRRDKLGDHLLASVLSMPAAPPGQNTGDFFPVKANSFVVNPGLTDDTIQLTFVQPRNGKTARVVVNWNGRILSGARISDKPAG